MGADSCLEEAVEDGPGDSRIPEDLAPILQGAVGGEDDGAPLVAAGERREEVLGGGGRQAAHARVFDNQEVHLPEAADELPAGAGSLGLSQVLDQVEGGATEGGLAGLDGGQGEAEGAAQAALQPAR